MTADALVEMLRTTRLTLLIGAAGSGKTQLLRDGVLRRLRRRTDDLLADPASTAPQGDAREERRRRTVRPRELVVYCDRWDGSPASQVHACLDEATGVSVKVSGPPRLPIALRAKALSAERGARLLFVFDHGDRVVAAPSDGVDPAAEYDALVNALCSVSPSVHLLLSAREGALPPSVQSRLGSPDTRVVRLPDPALGAAAVAETAGMPLGRSDVYASIAGRLAQIADRSLEADIGVTELAPRSARAQQQASLREVEPLASTPRPAASDAERPVASPTPETSAGPAGRSQDLSASPSFVPGVFARATVTRQARSRRRARAAGALVALLVVAGAGFVLWQERVETVPVADAPERRVVASTSRHDAAVERGAPAGIDARPGPLSDAASGSAQIPVTEAAASSPPASPPAQAASTELDATDPLSSELWQAMSRHGVSRFGEGGGGVGGLPPGRRLAVLPYDALRTLAAQRSAVRVVAPLFTEEMHVVVRADSPLSFIHQIAGRRVDFGPVESVRHQTAVAFYQRLFDRRPEAAETSTSELDAALAELLDGASLDAIVLPEPQPSARLARLPAAQLQRLRLLAAAPDDPSTRRALRSFLPATIRSPAGIGGPPVKSFAVMTFLVAAPAAPVGGGFTPADAARALCASLSELRRSGHPKWREVDPGQQLPVPLGQDPEAATVGRGCEAGRTAAVRRSTVAVSDADNDNPHRGERR